jgi:hypothetical protein
VIDPTEISDSATAVTMGRIVGWHTAEMMRRAPVRRPADPVPLTARPAISMELDVETATYYTAQLEDNHKADIHVFAGEDAINPADKRYKCTTGRVHQTRQ